VIERNEREQPKERVIGMLYSHQKKRENNIRIMASMGHINPVQSPMESSSANTISISFMNLKKHPQLVFIHNHIQRLL
jgi:hypothetical protein